MRIDVMGVEFDNLNLNEALTSALAMLEDGRGRYVVTPNPEIVMECRKDKDALAAVAEADLVIADGVGVVIASKILGTPLKAKVAGIDLAAALMAELSKTGGKLFLFGAKPGVAELAAERLSAEYPGLVICGTNDGYSIDSRSVIEKINRAAPDLLFVCMGAPKQEKWIREHIGRLDVGLAIGLGGALDVFAGTAKRAPEAFRRLGLEWLYRLMKEPKRIKRMIKLPLFISGACFGRLSGGKRR